MPENGDEEQHVNFICSEDDATICSWFLTVLESREKAVKTIICCVVVLGAFPQGHPNVLNCLDLKKKSVALKNN